MLIYVKGFVNVGLHNCRRLPNAWLCVSLSSSDNCRCLCICLYKYIWRRINQYLFPFDLEAIAKYWSTVNLWSGSTVIRPTSQIDYKKQKNKKLFSSYWQNLRFYISYRDVGFAIDKHRLWPWVDASFFGLKHRSWWLTMLE